jgi:hypothetical protein
LNISDVLDILGSSCSYADWIYYHGQ